jgi:hypothetical protein
MFALLRSRLWLHTSSSLAPSYLLRKAFDACLAFVTSLIPSSGAVKAYLAAAGKLRLVEKALYNRAISREEMV